MPLTRLITVDDAPVLAEVLRRNRDLVAPTTPGPDEDDFYTEQGQVKAVTEALRRHERGEQVPHVILDEDGNLVGRTGLSQIVRGPHLSANLGYFVDRRCQGRGLASRAVAVMVSVAFEELGLHRVEAGTVPENTASQRVLVKNGFERYGYARDYLNIAGRWRDHVLFQVLAPDRTDGPPAGVSPSAR